MKQTELEIDDTEVRRMFGEFAPKQRKQVFKKTILKGLNLVKKQAVRNLETVIDPDKITFNDKYGNSFKKGIKTKAYRDGKSGVIHILGNYKLKWFELGTEPRFNKKHKRRLMRKKRYVGQIKATHFFKRAKVSTEKEVFSNMDKNIKEFIIKISKKYNKGGKMR